MLLGAIGFVLAIGRYHVGTYLWLEGAFVVSTVVLSVLFFARAARPWVGTGRAAARALSVERPLRAFYEGVHHFRGHARLLIGLFAFTTAIQAVRVLAIWAAARAVGIELGPRIYYVMGPLFFLVLLVPFTLNGFAVREAFFVSFLGSVGVGADPAFAAGFLFFLVTVALAAPGGAVLLWEGIRGSGRRASSMADPGVASVVVTHDALPVARAVPRRASPDVARSSSTTAQATERPSSSASAFPACG